MTNLSCTFCNLVINSQKQWDDHAVGQKHLRAVKLAQASSGAGNNPPIATQNTPSPPRVPSPPVNQGADMTDAISGPNGSFECRVCPNFSCNGIIPMQAHLKGAKHLKALKRQAPDGYQAPLLLLSPLSGSVAASPKTAINSSTISNSAATSVFSVSSAATASSSVLASHNISMSSQSNSSSSVLSASCAVRQPDGQYKCSICDDGVIITGQIPMQQHLMGQKHLKNANRKALEKIQGLPAVPSVPANGYTSFVAPHNISSTSSPTKPNYSTPSVILDSCAVRQPDGHYKCSICDDGTVMSGEKPMQEHLLGKKHLKQVQRRNPVAPRPLSASPTPTAVASAVLKNRTPSPDIDMSSAVLHPNGNYGCADCTDFSCSGIVPMKDHLVGKSHQKSLNKKSPINNNKPPVVAKQLSFEKRDYSPLVSLTAEESVEKAWHHPIKCGYEYKDSFSTLPLADKIKSLSPHFAFLAHDEPIPNLSKYLA